ncbi:hypothetical protein N2152v2_003819 [Parachlorella kessleri]
MLIEDRYKRLVLLRRYIRVLALVATVFVPLRTAWHLLPTVLTGAPVAGLTMGIAGLGLALPLLQAYAFGFGKPHRERQWAVKIYSLTVFLLLSEVAISFYQYHMMWPKQDLYPALLVRQYPRGVYGLTPAALRLAAQVFEAVLDVVGIVALVALVLTTKEYILEKRSQKREGEAKKE